MPRNDTEKSESPKKRAPPRRKASEKPDVAPEPEPEQAPDALTVQQLLALAALLKGTNVSNAAKAASTSRETLHRWLKQPHFAAVFRVERAQIVEQAASVIQTNASEAARVMVAVMKDKSQPASVRLRAALAVSDAAIRWREVDSLAADVAELRKALGLRDSLEPASNKLEF
jgi:hypothetical protein